MRINVSSWKSNVIFSMILLTVFNGCSVRMPIQESLKVPVGLESIASNGDRFQGTGFIISESNHDSIVYLVTAKHLFLGDEYFKKVRILLSSEKVDSTEEEIISSNIYHDNWSYDNGYIVGSIDANPKHIFTNHNIKLVDIVVVPIRLPNIIKTEDKFFRPRVRMLSVSLIGKRDRIYFGDDVIMLGYPDQLGLVNPINRTKVLPTLPLLHFGKITWKHPVEPYFAVDIASQKGNSGSPVFNADFSLLFGVQAQIVVSQNKWPVYKSDTSKPSNDGMYVMPSSSISIMFYADDILPALEMAKEFISNYNHSSLFRFNVKTERDVFNGPSSRRPLGP